MRGSTRLAAIFVATLATAFALTLRSGHGEAITSASFAALPGSPSPALRIGSTRALDSGSVARWTTLREAATARVRPAADAPAIVRLASTTPEGTPSALQVVHSRPDSAGRLWVQVRLPALPNGRVGWVRRQVLGGYQTVATHLVVDRRKLRAVLYRDGKAVFAAPVGVGRAAWPTPGGSFLVRSRLTGYASPFYGPIAFGTTARSAVLTDWPGGGFVGIHGTNQPQLLPGRVSHGCIRMRNGDILRLARLMPVGTPLTIR
jgi:L,D-transpeptidase catalytic domain